MIENVKYGAISVMVVNEIYALNPTIKFNVKHKNLVYDYIKSEIISIKITILKILLKNMKYGAKFKIPESQSMMNSKSLDLFRYESSFIHPLTHSQTPGN